MQVKIIFDENYSNSTASICFICVSLLTHNEYFALWCEDSDLNLICIADRSELDFPSADVINAVITLWKILNGIEQNNFLMKQMVGATSKLCLFNSQFQG